MKTIFLLSGLLISFFCFGQNYEWVQTDWYQQDNIGESVGTDKYGNVYISGRFDNAPSIYGFVLSKYSHAGAHIWTDTLHNSWNVKTAVDENGNMYVLGNFRTSLNFGSHVLSATDYDYHHFI